MLLWNFLPGLIYDSSITCRKCSPDEALEIEEQPDNTVLAQSKRRHDLIVIFRLFIV